MNSLTEIYRIFRQWLRRRLSGGGDSTQGKERSEETPPPQEPVVVPPTPDGTKPPINTNPQADNGDNGGDKDTGAAGNGKKPGGYGGKRNGETNESPSGISPSPKSPTPKLPKSHLACKETNDGWAIAVEAADKAESVHQGGEELKKKDGGLFVVEEITGGKITVKFGDGRKDENISLGQMPLVFRMGKNRSEIGRRVKIKKVAGKHFVVFANKTYGEKNESPPIEPEPTIYPGVEAHFVAPSENGADFCLSGKRIADNANIGDIFVDVPEVKSNNNWDNIPAISFGEEKPDGKYLGEFNPAEQRGLGEKLKEEERARGGGRFFVRVYEKDGDRLNLCHSEDFRWLPGLEGILVNGEENWQSHPILPSASGHEKTSIQFMGHGFTAHPKNADINADDGNVFYAPPRENCDKTKWKVKNTQGGEIDVEITLPRVWWKLENGEWRGTPLEMKREKFFKKCAQDAKLKIKSPKNSGAVHARWSGGSDNQKCKDNQISFQKFRDYEQLDKPLAQKVFLEISFNDFKQSARVICLLADTPSPSPQPESKPKPEPEPEPVKKTRYGFVPRARGFSCGELREAGVCAKIAGVRFDKRRRTCHPQNIRLLTKE